MERFLTRSLARPGEVVLVISTINLEIEEANEARRLN